MNWVYRLSGSMSQADDWHRRRGPRARAATRRSSGLTCGLLLFAGSLTMSPAQADWLATVWPNSVDVKSGNPAITLNADSVSVVLPEAVLAEAQTAGLSVEDAVRAFLGRYAPKMCSSVLDMGSVHLGLKVELRIQRPAAAQAMESSTQEDAALALNEALKRGEAGSAAISRLQHAFVVEPNSRTLLIDYVPEKKTNCVLPPDALF